MYSDLPNLIGEGKYTVTDPLFAPVNCKPLLPRLMNGMTPVEYIQQLRTQLSCSFN